MVGATSERAVLSGGWRRWCRRPSVQNRPPIARCSAGGRARTQLSRSRSIRPHVRRFKDGPAYDSQARPLWRVTLGVPPPGGHWLRPTPVHPEGRQTFRNHPPNPSSKLLARILLFIQFLIPYLLEGCVSAKILREFAHQNLWWCVMEIENFLNNLHIVSGKIY